MLPLVLLIFPLPSAAHDHAAQPEMLDPSIPIDPILWTHIVIQAFVWCILWPIGLVLGVTRSRWHVPVQSTGFLLTAAGYILGHNHKGRAFPVSFHSKFAPWLLFPLGLQLSVGIYLKLHINEKTLRPYAVTAHRWVAFIFPLFGSIQVLLGLLVLLGVCLPQSAENMTSIARPLVNCIQTIGASIGLVTYGVINYAFIGHSKGSEWIDSFSITFGGVLILVSGWFYREMNQASLGLFWMVGGILGISLSNGRMRNIIPGAIIMATGIASSLRTHAGFTSTDIEPIAHLETAFSYTLALAGLVRVIDIYFTSGVASNGSSSRQHVTPFLLMTSGLFYLVSHPEQATYLSSIGLQSSSVIFLGISVSLTLYSFLIFLTHLHATTGRHATKVPETYALVSQAPVRHRAPPATSDDREKEIYTLTQDNDSDFEEDELDPSRERHPRTRAVVV